MPARGKIQIKNASGQSQTHLRLEYGGTIDKVHCDSFSYVSWGGGRIDLAHGTIANGAGITLEWEDFQGRGPTWKGSPHWVKGSGGTLQVDASQEKSDVLPGAFEG